MCPFVYETHHHHNRHHCHQQVAAEADAFEAMREQLLAGLEDHASVQDLKVGGCMRLRSRANKESTSYSTSQRANQRTAFMKVSGGICHDCLFIQRERLFGCLSNSFPIPYLIISK